MGEMTQIIQCFLPPLEAGMYNIQVNQTINASGETKIADNISKSLDFAVDAARFTLNSGDIYSVYPPANKFGTYTETLPHIVFSRRTLPWERTIDGLPPVCERKETTKEKQSPEASQPTPWMALILLNEDEMKGLKIVKNTLANVIQPEEKGITRTCIFDSGPSDDKLRLMKWEHATDGCFTIDLTQELFEKHIPSLDSLPYLAHAKVVSIDNKDKDGITDMNPDDGAGVFSVVVGNSLPTPGKQHTALLVSLEGFHDYLLSGGIRATNITEGNKFRIIQVMLLFHN